MCSTDSWPGTGHGLLPLPTFHASPYGRTFLALPFRESVCDALWAGCHVTQRRSVAGAPTFGGTIPPGLPCRLVTGQDARQARRSIPAPYRGHVTVKLGPRPVPRRTPPGL